MLFWSLRTESSAITSYEAVRVFQQRLVELRAQDLIEDTVLFLEHEPVVTQGRGLQFVHGEGADRPRHMPVPKLPESISFFESERGGDLTYHGPGQLVIYPICKMDGKGFAPLHDVAAFIRKLEGVIMAEIDHRFQQAKISARAQAVKEATGVWIKSDDLEKSPMKVASVGIAVRKWVNYHGASINCVNDLAPFHLISPCGFSPEVMTRLDQWVGLPSEWRSDLEASFARRFSMEAMDGDPVGIDSITLVEASSRLDQIEADARNIAGQV